METIISADMTMVNTTPAITTITSATSTTTSSSSSSSAAAATTTPTITINPIVTSSNNKVIYSSPGSPPSTPINVLRTSSPLPSSPMPMPMPTTHVNDFSIPASGTNSPTQHYHHSSPTSPTYAVNQNPLCTPIKHSYHHHQQQQQQQQHPDQQSQSEVTIGEENVLHTIRERLRTPGGVSELQSLRFEYYQSKPLNVIKDRYLVSSHRYQMSPTAAAKTPASYRHLIDLTSSHLRCTDVFTEKQYLCKIVNEPVEKVKLAYFRLLETNAENCQSTIYGHSLIRGIHDIVKLNEQRTYVIIAPPPLPQLQTTTTTATTKKLRNQNCKNNNNNINNDDSDVNNDDGGGGDGDDNEQTATTTVNNDIDYCYEDLHTYIRNKRRLCEAEARALFHQICQTVQVCHRNGVILRDLKLKRFYFIDEARTKLQYESLEGSMILDDPDNDTLKDKIGCPLYTAPELLCQNSTYRGKPADMWSLGVLLYTMLVGQYPFYEKGNCSLITVIRHCQVQIPSMLTRSVRWLLLSLLKKNHEERMCIEYILYTPWLREQRPYYMNIPANISIPMDDSDEDNNDSYSIDNGNKNDGNNIDNDIVMDEDHETEAQEFITNSKHIKIDEGNRKRKSLPTTTTTTTATKMMTATSDSLDYTCATLQTDGSTSISTTSSLTLPLLRTTKFTAPEIFTQNHPFESDVDSDSDNDSEEDGDDDNDDNDDDDDIGDDDEDDDNDSDVDIEMG